MADLRVDEAGNHGAPAEVDNCGFGSIWCHHLTEGTDRKNATSSDRHRLGRWAGVVGRDDRPAMPDFLSDLLSSGLPVGSRTARATIQSARDSEFMVGLTCEASTEGQQKDDHDTVEDHGIYSGRPDGGQLREDIGLDEVSCAQSAPAPLRSEPSVTSTIQRKWHSTARKSAMFGVHSTIGSEKAAP